MYLPPLTSVCSILRPLSPACRNRNCAGRTDVSRWYARTRPRLHPRGRLRRFAGASQLPSMAQPQIRSRPPMLITPTSNSAHTDRKKKANIDRTATIVTQLHVLHRTPGRGRSAFFRVVPLAEYGLYAIDTALHSASLRQLSGDPRNRSVPPAQTSL